MELLIKKIIKNIINLFFILITISIITFLLVKLSPGDPAVNYLRASHISITSETLNATRENLGLNEPIIIQYYNWLLNILNGNLGISYTNKKNVTDLILNALGPTLQLGIFSFLLLVIVTSILSFISILYKNKIVNFIIKGICYIGVSLPTFWVGYILIIIFSVKLKILPVSGRGSVKHLILPSITLIIPLIAQTTFFIRKNVEEVMKELHYENSVILGVSTYFLIKNHIIKNIAIPLVTVLSSNFLYVITGSVVIEEIFGWPGIGKLFAASVRAGDLPLIQGQLLLFGILSILINELTQYIVKKLNPKLNIGKI